MMKNSVLQAGLLSAILMLSGCLGAGTAAVGPSGSALLPTTQTARLARSAGRQQPVLFVADFGGSVGLYSANIQQHNPPLLGSITQGVTRPNGLWIDRQGTLYVTNLSTPPSVAEYKRGASTPFKVITNGLFTPLFPAVDSAGTLYVDDSKSSGVVLVYRPGASSPSRTIQIPNQGGRSQLGSMTFDQKGDLLVGTFNVKTQIAVVYSIAPGSSQPQNLHLQGISGNSLGTDKAWNLYVAGVQGNIAVFAPGSKTPSRLMNAGITGFYSFLTVTPNGTLYWPNYDAGEVFEFAPGASSPTNSFHANGVDAAVGLR